MLTGCKILQWWMAIVIVLTLIMIALIMSRGGGVNILVVGAINIGISAVIYKIYMDCAKRQDILEKYKISVNPFELDKELAKTRGEKEEKKQEEEKKDE